MADLPDDVAALKAIVIAVHARNERLEQLVAAFKQAMFGRKSERLDPDQFELALEDVETGIATIKAEEETCKLTPKPTIASPRAANRGSLPKHLPRVGEVIEPAASVCGCGGGLHQIGEDVSERLDVIPAQFRVIVTRRPKYACRSCSNGVVQAPAPARLIPGGMPTEAAVAHVLVSKYADHLPLYRQAQIYSRQGIDLDRSTLAAWVGKAAYELKPVFTALIADLKRSTKPFMDETRAPVLDPKAGKTKTGYFWALARDDRPWGGAAPPGVAFTYAPGRCGQYPVDILQDFAGILQVDGYAGYNRLIQPDRAGPAIRLAYCWAHARRKLFEVARNSTAPIAEDGLKRIAGLYKIEAEIRALAPEAQGHPSRPVSSKDRRLRDLAHPPPRPRVRQISFGRGAEIHRKILGWPLPLPRRRTDRDGQQHRRAHHPPIALNRKNALFAGHDAGAENWATIASLVETCKQRHRAARLSDRNTPGHRQRA